MHVALKLLAPPLVVVIAAGLWFWSGVVAPGYWSTIVLGALCFVACSMMFGRIGKARPDLRWWVRGPFLACCVAAVFGFHLDVGARHGRRRGRRHGRAGQQGGGRGRRRRSARAAGRAGRGRRLARYDTVVFWCVPFSKSLASAALQAA